MLIQAKVELSEYANKVCSDQSARAALFLQPRILSNLTLSEGFDQLHACADGPSIMAVTFFVTQPIFFLVNPPY